MSVVLRITWLSPLQVCIFLFRSYPSGSTRKDKCLTSTHSALPCTLSAIQSITKTEFFNKVWGWNFPSYDSYHIINNQVMTSVEVRNSTHQQISFTDQSRGRMLIGCTDKHHKGGGIDIPLQRRMKAAWTSPCCFESCSKYTVHPNMIKINSYVTQNFYLNNF